MSNNWETRKKFKNIVLLMILGMVLAAVLSFGTRLYLHLGLGKSVQIQVVQMPAVSMIGLPHMGPYHKIVPSIEKVEQWMKDHGFPCERSFGLYLDNPRVIEEVRLRSRGGCIVSNDFIESKEFQAIKSVSWPPDFQIETLPPQKTIEAKFEGAPSAGPLKVYPAVEKLIVEKKSEAYKRTLEIYEILPDARVRTTYYFLFGDM